MTTAGAQRVPVLHAFLPVRLGITVLLGVPWAIFVWIAVGLADDQPGEAVITAIVLLVVALIWFRIVFVRVVLRPDELVVRNYLRTHRVPRAEIADFRVHGPGAATNSTKLVARRRDGRELRLNIGSLSFLLAGTRWLEGLTATLMVWNANGTLPSSSSGTPPARRRR